MSTHPAVVTVAIRAPFLRYALQILKYYGYRTLITTASKQHHKFLNSLGAAHVFAYRNPDVTTQILTSVPAVQTSDKPAIPLS